VLEANTRSAHLGEESSTIEIARGTLTVEEAHSVEDFANSVVFENRAIKTYFRSEDELTSIPLRRTPKKKGRIRIVEIDGFDYTPCGGTHCRHTGEIGLIKTGRWEKIRGHVRIQFLCGNRALSEYRWKSDAVEELADRFSARGGDVLSLVTKQTDEMKALKGSLKELTERTLRLEAYELLSKATVLGEIKIVKAVFHNRPSEDIKTLATMTTESEKSIALLGNCDEKGQLIFACSKGLTYKMNDLITGASAAIGGRGGGSPNLAFGGGPKSEIVGEAIERVFQHIVKGQK
jgi:alanyl-tRNA synthetase